MSPLLAEPVDIAIVDYGMGNRRSVEKALEHVGAHAAISSDPERLRAAAGLILPGVGAFPRAMRNLSELGLDELVQRAPSRRARRCSASASACSSPSTPPPSWAAPPAWGSWPARSSRCAPASCKLPHIGWNEVRFARPESPLLAGLPERCAFYHVHSLAPVPTNAEDVLGTADYGGEFVTAVERGCFYGVQFHPEKSSAAGLRLLANFARICVAAGATVGR